MLNYQTVFVRAGYTEYNHIRSFYILDERCHRGQHPERRLPPSPSHRCRQLCGHGRRLLEASHSTASACATLLDDDRVALSGYALRMGAVHALGVG